MGGAGEDERGRLEDVAVEARSSLILEVVERQQDGDKLLSDLVFGMPLGEFRDGVTDVDTNAKYRRCSSSVRGHDVDCDASHGSPWSLGDQQGWRSSVSTKL